MKKLCIVFGLATNMCTLLYPMDLIERPGGGLLVFTVFGQTLPQFNSDSQAVKKRRDFVEQSPNGCSTS